MPYTVDYSFTLFRSQYVDLAPTAVTTARKSRDYLKDQITAVVGKNEQFPHLSGGYLAFGSFARKTKAMVLDDIDLLLLLNGTGTTAIHLSGYTYGVYVDDTTRPIWLYTDDYNFVSSTRVLNTLKSTLSSIPNYRKAEVKRTGVAVVLDLASYTWVFDIVPAIPIGDGQGGTAYYLIPDGTGAWMRTDPRKDQQAVTEANTQHNGLLLPLMRLLKYWNMRYYATPRIPSYYLEAMLIDGFQYYPSIASIKEGIPIAFQLLKTNVQYSCPDPKGLGSNLEVGVSWDTRMKVRDTAESMADYARSALYLEKQDNHKGAIEQWQSIFHDFPAYGG